jgi:hypothetical protein
LVGAPEGLFCEFGLGRDAAVAWPSAPRIAEDGKDSPGKARRGEVVVRGMCAGVV